MLRSAAAMMLRRLAAASAPRTLGAARRTLASGTGPRTLYDKIWDDHLVDGTTSDVKDGTGLLYIDRHLVHEVTSPQAFEGLSVAGRPVRRPDCTLVTVDHNIPTTSRKKFKDTASFIEEEQSRAQVMALERNVEQFGLPYFGMQDKRQGVVHIIGPEQGFTVPGGTCVCGDSHTTKSSQQVCPPRESRQRRTLRDMFCAPVSAAAAVTILTKISTHT